MKLPRGLTRLIATATLCFGLGGQGFAQSAFSPAILVNDEIVTYYEIEQRALLLAIMNAPGNTRELAREQLVNERLQNQAAELAGIRPSEEGVLQGISAFGQRVGMEPDQLIEALGREGVSEEALRDFIYANISWQGLVQTRFGQSVQISEAEIDRAIASNTGAGGINVLLSEIVMQVNPQNIRQVEAIADQISQITSQEEFSDAARQYSQAATKDKGGRLDWLSITKLPAELRPVIVSLKINQVSAPVQLPNAIALFQMRGKAETSTPPPSYSAIDYMTLKLPGGRTPDTLELARELRGHIDTCDDLYGEAQKMPPENLERFTVAPSKIPRDIALELAKLDENEVSTNLTRVSASGQPVMMFIMLCGRTASLPDEISRETVASALRDQRLQSFALGYLAQLRADAMIVEK